MGVDVMLHLATDRCLGRCGEVVAPQRPSEVGSLMGTGSAFGPVQ